VRHRTALGLAFLIGAATIAGLPPSSGFIGKLMVLQSVGGGSYGGAIWLLVLSTSLLMVVGSVRAGSLVLWGPGSSTEVAQRETPRAGEWAALAFLLAAGALLVVFAKPLKGYADVAARELASPSRYIDVVLGSARSQLLKSPNRD
jgi:multicomponent K+:H+ antiporter subunit D